MIIMKLNEGRLQTAEHILVRTLERKFPDVTFVISEFKEKTGRVEISAKTDLREGSQTELEDEVNAIINKDLLVKKYILQRRDAEKEFDLARVPSSVKEVRIVEIEDFDKTPCKDLHVKRTGEIGRFKILKIEKTGKDRFRFLFTVK